MAKPDRFPAPMIYEQIAAKDFTLVLVLWPGERQAQEMVVGSPFLAQAKARAVAAIPRLFPDAGPPKAIHYYPRTYVDQAKSLYKRGLHD